MTRPPYVRWAVAASLVIVAFVWDTRPISTVPYPFAANDLTAGTMLTAADVEIRDIPAGVLATPAARTGLRMRHSVTAGTPLAAWVVTDDALMPPGWWAVPMALSSDVSSGDPVRIVWTATGTPAAVDGLAVRAGPDGLVAVPPESAAAVASAARRSEVIVLVQGGR